jgi:hypothetical protein
MPCTKGFTIIMFRHINFRCPSTNNHFASTISKCLKYVVLPLNFGPHLQNTHGIGIIATVMNPSKLVAHAKPRRSIICTVKSGKLDETTKRMNVEAASTLAP